MTIIETEVAVLKSKVDILDKNLTKHMQEQREDFDKVFEKIDSLGGKFANKWVEKLSIGLLVTVIGGVVVLIINNI